MDRSIDLWLLKADLLSKIRVAALNWPLLEIQFMEPNKPAKRCKLALIKSHPASNFAALDPLERVQVGSSGF